MSPRTTDPWTVRLVTLEQARTWLATSEAERQIPGRVARYAGLYAGQQWRPGHEDRPVVVRGGKLVDGNHRLHAILLHGRAVRLGVEAD